MTDQFALVPIRLLRWFGLFVMTLVLMMLTSGVASSHGVAAPLPADCKPDAPKFAGITHCVIGGENVHVVLVNLETSGLRFETALPIAPNGQECTDVNTKAYVAPNRPGCNQSTLYPFEPVASIAKRYKTKDQNLRMAINADYFGSDDHGHGAEGLTVKNGQRFDGWELGDCDGDGELNRDGKTKFDHRTPAPCDGNDVNRPALTISRSNRVEIGYRTPEEVDNKSLYTDRFYNAVGGGPLIVVGGKPLNNDACNNPDPRRALPRVRVCDRKSQSAVALSGDGKTLILAMGDRDTAGMAQLFTQTFQEYRIQTALKLDGGGSPTLWFDDQVYGSTESKGTTPVGEALLIFAPVASEFDATVDNQTDVLLADPGQRLTINLTFTNTGIKPWNSQNLVLVNTNNQPLGTNPAQQVGGTRQISPGATLPLTLLVQAPNGTGLYASEWQLKHGDQAVGPKVSRSVIVLPPEAKELRERIQAEIDKWRKSGEQKIDELVRQIQKEIEEWIKREAPGLIEKMLRQMGCSANLVVWFGAALGVSLLRLRY